MDLPRLGNQLADPVSTMPATGDDRAAADLDESNIYMGGPSPRRHDDDDEGSDIAEDDDAESTASVPIAGGAKAQGKSEEEKELPQHACA